MSSRQHNQVVFSGDHLHSIHDPVPVDEPTKKGKSKVSHRDGDVEMVAEESNERGHIAGFYHGAPGIKHHYKHNK